MKHTNGKWQIKKRLGSEMYDIVSPLHTQWQIAEAILERDVKLISKAPEMYEALKEIKKISKRLNLWVGIDTIINPLLNDIDNGNK